MSQKLSLFIVYVILSSFLQPIQAEDTIYYPSEIYFEGDGRNYETDPNYLYIYKKIGNCIQFKFVVNTRENYFIKFTNEDYKKLDAGETIITRTTSNFFNFIGYDTVINYYQSVLINKKIKSEYLKSEHAFVFIWHDVIDFFVYYGMLIVIFTYLSITNATKFLKVSKMDHIIKFLILIITNYMIVVAWAAFIKIFDGDRTIYLFYCLGSNIGTSIILFYFSNRLSVKLSDIRPRLKQQYGHKNPKAYIAVSYAVLNEFLIFLYIILFSYIYLQKLLSSTSDINSNTLDYLGYIAYLAVIAGLYFVIDKIVSSFKKNV